MRSIIFRKGQNYLCPLCQSAVLVVIVARTDVLRAPTQNTKFMVGKRQATVRNLELAWIFWLLNMTMPKEMDKKFFMLAQ